MAMVPILPTSESGTTTAFELYIGPVSVKLMLWSQTQWNISISLVSRYFPWSPGHLFDIRNPIFDGTNLSRETSNIIWNVPRSPLHRERSEAIPIYSRRLRNIWGWYVKPDIFSIWPKSVQYSILREGGRRLPDNKIWSIVISVVECGGLWEMWCCVGQIWKYSTTGTCYKLTGLASIHITTD